jgi:hypothetical protein
MVLVFVRTVINAFQLLHVRQDLVPINAIPHVTYVVGMLPSQLMGIITTVENVPVFHQVLHSCLHLVNVEKVNDTF